MDGSIDPVEVAGVTLVLLPVPPVELLEPVLLGEPAVPDELVPVLLGAEVPVAEVPLTGVPVPVVGVDPVAVPLDGAVPAGVDDDVPVVETGALGSAGVAAEVPSGLEVDASRHGRGRRVAGSSRLGGVPGRYRVVSWSGSSVSVSGIPNAGSCRSAASDDGRSRVDDGVGVSGLEAELVAGRRSSSPGRRRSG